MQFLTGDCSDLRTFELFPEEAASLRPQTMADAVDLIWADPETLIQPLEKMGQYFADQSGVDCGQRVRDELSPAAPIDD